MCGRVTSYLKFLYELLIKKEEFLIEEDITVIGSALYEPHSPCDSPPRNPSPVDSTRYNLRVRSKVNYAEPPELIE